MARSAECCEPEGDRDAQRCPVVHSARTPARVRASLPFPPLEACHRQSRRVSLGIRDNRSKLFVRAIWFASRYPRYGAQFQKYSIHGPVSRGRKVRQNSGEWYPKLSLHLDLSRRQKNRRELTPVFIVT